MQAVSRGLHPTLQSSPWIALITAHAQNQLISNVIEISLTHSTFSAWLLNLRLKISEKRIGQLTPS